MKYVVVVLIVLFASVAVAETVDLNGCGCQYQKLPYKNSKVVGWALVNMCPTHRAESEKAALEHQKEVAEREATMELEARRKAELDKIADAAIEAKSL